MDSHPLTTPVCPDLGDLAGFGRLYRESAGLVRGMLSRLGVHRAVLDDATQDVFVVAYRRRAEFDRDRPIEPWLVGIARRVAFRYRRGAARGQRKLAALAQVGEAPPGDHLAAQIEARRFLEHFIRELREERREVFVLGELYGLTGPEIAARLQIPVDTAYTRLRATRRQLEQALLTTAVEDPPPTGVALHRGWLLLAPRLGESNGWIPLALGKAKLALVGVTVVTAALAVAPSVHRPPAPPRAEEPASRAPARIATRPPSADIVPLTPPPASRFEALLTASPATSRALRPAPRDPLGASLLTAALESLGAGDSAIALAKLEQHAREFPTSPLAEARAITRIRALCQLGNLALAREEAALLRSEGLAHDVLAGTCAVDP